MTRVAIAVLFFIALVVAGIWFDIGWLLIGGIEEIVRGCQATPASVHDIVIGSIRVFCTGVGIGIGFLLGWLGCVLIIGDN